MAAAGTEASVIDDMEGTRFFEDVYELNRSVEIRLSAAHTSRRLKYPSLPWQIRGVEERSNSVSR